jgi:hypothetical protein
VTFEWFHIEVLQERVMSHPAIANLRFTLNRLEGVLESIRTEDFEKRPAPNLNPPIWLLGHIVVSIDGTSKYIGEPYLLSMAFHKNFTSGSVPFENETPYPSRAELIERLHAVSERIISLVENLSEESLQQEHGVTTFETGPLRSMGDVLVLLMVGHVALHVGHLEWAAKLLTAARQ